MKLDVWLIWANALVFGLYGLGCVVAPEAMLYWATGSAPATASGVIDVRATYGGMSAAVGALLLLLAWRPETVRIGVWAVLLLMLGMAGGRSVGLLLDGSGNAVMWTYFGLEILTATAALLLLRRTRPG